jgi:hypothetical protein
MEPTENKDTFLNWACAEMGNYLDADPKFQKMSILDSIIYSNMYDAAVITLSLMASQPIAEFARPRVKKIGPNPASIRTSFGNPGGEYLATTGHDVLDMQDRGVDPGLREIYSTTEAIMNQTSGVSKVLQTQDANPNEPYSLYTQRIGAAMEALSPQKSILEPCWKRICELMLLNVEASGVPLTGYGWKPEGESSKREKYTIDSESIDPENLYLEVRMTIDPPGSNLQKVNAVMQKKQNFPIPDATLMDELGYDDPEGEINKWSYDQMRNAMVQANVQNIQLEESGKLQQLIEQRAQELVQQMTEQAAEAPAPAEGQPMGMNGKQTGQMPGEGLGMPEAQGGNRAVPAEGGLPAAQFNPNANVKEQATGLNRLGGPG